MASGSNTSPYGFQSPLASYVFDNLIADLSLAMSEQELEELKQRFAPRQILTPIGMFFSLKKKGIIDTYNIVYIQLIVRLLDRWDLVEILRQYVEMFEDTVLHFYWKTTVVAVGFTVTQLHIKGIRNSTTCQQEKLRSAVCRLLLCSPHDVIIDGI